MDSIASPSIDLLRNTFDALPGAFFLTDKNSQVVYVNKAVEKRTGFAVAEVIGKKPRELWGGNMTPDFYHELWKQIKQKQLPFVGEAVNRNKNGEAFVDQLQIAPIFDESGAIAYYIEIQPEFDKPSRTARFQTEFQSALSQQQIFGSDIIEWMLPWLDPQSGPLQRTKEMIKDLGQATKHLGSFLADVFVLPTQRFFYAREEDRELILMAQEDSHAFKKLYIKYKKEIHRYFLHHLRGNNVLAEDLLQETFYRALRYLSSFRSTNASYRTYLLRVAHSVLINYYRKDQPLLIEEKDFDRPDNHREFKDAVNEDRVRQSMIFLSEAEQQLVQMYYEEELSVHEIASLLNKTENAVKLGLSRARKRLKEVLQEN